VVRTRLADDVVKFAVPAHMEIICASGVPWQATPAAQNLRPKRQHLIACVHCFDTDTTTPTAIMSLISGEKSSFQFILRLLNTNVCPTIPLRDLAQLGEERTGCVGARWWVLIRIQYRSMASKRLCTP